jgi:uncharacterized protein
VTASSRDVFRRHRETRLLTSRGPSLMLLARPAFAVGAQALVAAAFALRGSPTPWRDTQPWLPVYGTMVDAACLALLWRLTKREGTRLFDLVGFARTRLVHDVLLGLALIPVSLVFIFAGTYAAGWLVYGAPAQPYFFGRLPLPAALYGVLVWPFIWGLTEQMTYNGYLLPRVGVLCRRSSVAVAIVTLVWAAQHAVMPVTFDARFMAFRTLSAIPYAAFLTLSYLQLRRLIPLAVAHAVLDGASVLISALLPLLRS